MHIRHHSSQSVRCKGDAVPRSPPDASVFLFQIVRRIKRPVFYGGSGYPHTVHLHRHLLRLLPFIDAVGYAVAVGWYAQRACVAVVNRVGCNRHTAVHHRHAFASVHIGGANGQIIIRCNEDIGSKSFQNNLTPTLE